MGTGYILKIEVIGSADGLEGAVKKEEGFKDVPKVFGLSK